MKTLRKMSMCLLMSVILLVVPAVFAQDQTFGLSDADFALLTAANAGLADIDSATFDLTVAFSVTGMGDDASADITGSGVLSADPANPLFSVALSGSSTSDGETTPINAEMRLVDGMLYLNDGSGWKGQPAEDLASDVGSMAGGMTGMDVNPEDLASGDLSDLSGMEGMSEAMAALANLDPSEFISITRSDDAGLALFTIDLSISDLLNSPSLAPLFTSALSMGGDVEGMEMSQEQMQAMTGMFAAMFAEATVTVEQWIDPATTQLQRVALDVSLPIPDMSGSGNGTVTVAFNFDLSLSGFGEPVTVEVPENVELVESGS